jgi:hypothetical protein
MAPSTVIGIIVIIAATAYIYFYIKRRSSGSRISSRMQTPDLEKDKSIPDMPVGFGYKCLWFSIKSENVQRIAEILKLGSLEPCNWDVGIDKAYKDAVFISPAIDGWTFTVGWGLLSAIGETPDGIKEVKEYLRQLSHEFGEAQYFYTHRITEYHFWAKAVNGKITRAYSYIGESGENIIVEGEPTVIEKKYNLVNTFSKEAQQKNYFDNVDVPNEGMVMEVAGSWSVDPTKLEDRKDLKEGMGWLYTSS